MSSLWTDLLVLHGHIHDPELARRLANTPSMPPPDRPGGKRQRTRSPFAALASLCSLFVIPGRPEARTKPAAGEQHGCRE